MAQKNFTREEVTLSAEKTQVHCCIAGGGPAGMMLGFLLARAGVEVTVVEKHGDFLRDFRLSAPWFFRLLQRWPRLRRIPARLIGIGFRPEHVRTPEVLRGRQA